MLKGLLSSYIIYPLAERIEKRNIRGKLKETHAHYQKSFTLREALQKKSLYEQVCFAEKNVPYYRDLFKKIQFNPEKLKTDARFLNDIPFLDKVIILEQGDRLLVDSRDQYKDYPCKTGGSTGHSVIIHYDQVAADWSAATTLYARNQCGNHRHKKELHLSSELPGNPSKRDIRREMLKCISMNRKNVLYHAFDDHEIDRILKKIKSAKAHLVHGHPSTLYTLALAQKEKKNSQKIFSVFESSGEYLSPRKAKAIQEAFQCQIVNRYGLAEAGVIAYQTGNQLDNLFLFDHMVFAETVLDEIVITNLKNSYMPLLRYKTGDLGNIVRKEDGFYIDDLRGRVHDSVTIDGKVYLTHYIQDLLDRLGGVSDFQIATKKEKNPVLRIVLENKDAKQNLEEKIKTVFHDQLPIEYITMNDLKLVGRRHKFRYVVNEA